METAVQHALRIPELLESILLHLPQKDLLLSQRTSRSFRQIVQGSIRLQQALFFAPDRRSQRRASKPSSSKYEIGQKPENNRLLLRAFPAHYPTVSLVIDPTPNEKTIGLGGPEHWSWDVCISLPADAPPKCSPAVFYPEASWRRMYLSQPPCTDLHLIRRWQKSLRPALVEPEGVRMGKLYDQALGAKGKESWHHSYISSDRDWHFEGNIQWSEVSE